MSDSGNLSSPVRLNLLLFSVAGVCFGMETEQVEGTTAYSGETADDLFWFHNELGWAEDTANYRAPAIVSVKTADSASYRVIIGALEDIAEIEAGDIRLFPSLVEPFALKKGMWGVAVMEGRMILLIDFQRILRNKSSNATVD